MSVIVFFRLNFWKLRSLFIYVHFITKLNSNCLEVFIKNIVLIFSQSSQENTCDGVFYFNKVADRSLVTLLERDCGRGVSCELCETFKNTFFVERLWTAASLKVQTCINCKIESITLLFKILFHFRKNEIFHDCRILIFFK